MSVRIIKYLTPVLQPLYRRYVSTTRSYRYRDIRVDVHPGVFYPGFIFSTKMLLQFLDTMDLNRKTLLELGAGSGIVSILAARRGAKVTATDINPAAVENIRENAGKNSAGVTVIRSDLFGKIPQTAFDHIIIAPPYYPKTPADWAEMAWYCGSNFEYFERLFMQLPAYFHDRANIFMILSEDCNIERIEEIAGKNGFAFSLIRKKRKLGEWNFIFKIGRKESLPQ